MPPKAGSIVNRSPLKACLVADRCTQLFNQTVVPRHADNGTLQADAKSLGPVLQRERTAIGCETTCKGKDGGLQHSSPGKKLHL
eukprot:5465946-Amphidinium_carterae.1